LSDSFKAQVALRSWVGSLVIPDLTVPMDIISNIVKCQTMSRKGKEKARDSDIIDIDSD
jgi:hypothetical protein